MNKTRRRLPQCEAITPAAPLTPGHLIRRLRRDFALQLNFSEAAKARMQDFNRGAFIAFMTIPAGTCHLVGWNADSFAAVDYGVRINTRSDAVYFLVNAERATREESL